MAKLRMSQSWPALKVALFRGAFGLTVSVSPGILWKCRILSLRTVDPNLHFKIIRWLVSTLKFGEGCLVLKSTFMQLKENIEKIPFEMLFICGPLWFLPNYRLDYISWSFSCHALTFSFELVLQGFCVIPASVILFSGPFWWLLLLVKMVLWL